MLQTDEVDEDYFTPTSSTTLSTIFKSPNKPDIVSDNESLKYIPKPQITSKPVTKVTECIFACALFAYEWVNNNYIAKGKVGFAILKYLKTQSLDIILYDSNKTTLSHATITTKLNVTVKGNQYISYYDNNNKCWSLYGTDTEIKQLIDILAKFNTTLISSSDSGDLEPPNFNILETEKPILAVEQYEIQQDNGSDTDSSLNRRTKDSILSRMANMGQSVLPRRVTSEKTSDSSDSAESITLSKTIKKPIKSYNTKRPSSDCNTVDGQNPSEVSNKIIAPLTAKTITGPLYTLVDGKMMSDKTEPLSLDQYKGDNFGLFMIEQRVSNSELRINMGRITDKIDHVAHKLDSSSKEIDPNNIGINPNIQMEIVTKLLSEYESKIKSYEQIIESKQIKTDMPSLPTNSFEKSDVDWKRELTDLKEIIQVKNNEISNLNQKLDNLEKTSTQTLEVLLKEVSDLKQIVQREKSPNTNEMATKLKSVMNDTFKTISANFNNDEQYSGDTVINIVASVIKQVTIDSLNEKTD